MRGLYTIKKGTHRSKKNNSILRLPMLHFGKIDIEFNVTFRDSCKYEEKELPYSGINKLFGISRMHHNEKFLKKLCNSWIVGWKSINFEEGYRIVFYSYTDYQGEESRNLVVGGRFNFDIPIKVKALEANGQVYWTLTQDRTEINFLQKVGLSSPKIGYYLYPYFGGKSEAPHDMEIEFS